MIDMHSHFFAPVTREQARAADWAAQMNEQVQQPR